MRWLALLTAYSVLSTQYSAAADKPVPTKDAASKMTVPEGFRVTLFAGEPDIVQPIAFTFDARGRMWVVECVTYPKWVQPGQKGKDRVVILEDTNGDGTHDKKSVVLDDGVNLSGIELGFGGVYLCSTPNLVFVPIKDDKPAGAPEVLLDGWNLKDAKHNVFNGLGWGPDGWLYGCNGIQTKSRVGKPGTPDDKRVYLDCGVWRYHPTRRVFEVVGHGTTNPWGIDWDDYGEAFITNCVIDHLWHVVPGGHYQRMYGQDANPYSFGLMGPASDHKHWAGGHWTESRADQKSGAVKKGHDDAGGGHAHSGCAVYTGDNFPAEYRNSVFTCNIHGNRVNRDTLDRDGGYYTGKHAPDFLHANDPWFRGVCVKCGPDGGLYVADWSDTGECHNYDVADTTNGRIYRVTFGNPKPWQTDLTKLSDQELLALRVHRNDWVVRQGRRLLQERAAAGKLGAGVEAEVRKVWEQPRALDATEAGQLRLLWLLHAVGRLTAEDVAAQVGRTNFTTVRAWAVRLAADDPEPDEQFKPEVLERLGRDSNPWVRRAVLSACVRLSPRTARTVLIDVMKSLARERGADDKLTPHEELLFWYAAGRAAADTPEWVHDLLDVSLAPRVSEYTARWYLATSTAAQFDTRLDRLFARHVTGQEGPPRRLASDLAVVRGVSEALSGRKNVPIPKNWPGVYRRFYKATPEAEVPAMALGLRFGDPAVVKLLKERAADATENPVTRVEWVRLLAAHRAEGFAATLRGLLGDLVVRGAAVRGLASSPDTETAAAILKAYPAFTAGEKSDAVLTLASRPAFALALLDAVEKGTVSKADVSVFAARQILALNDKAVGDKLAKAWGTIRPASATRAAQVKRIKEFATAEALKTADLSHGRAVFVKTCAACHKLFGEGGEVGPELTGSQRANLDYVLENVLDPNAVVPYDYKMTAFYLHDGRVVTGQVRKETPQAVTVRTANDEVVIAVADIERRKSTNDSVMPEGLIDALKEGEVRDLIAYLASPKQVPLK